MDAAEAAHGTKEVPGKGSNPAVVTYYAEAGHPEIDDDEPAWCAAFAGAMLKRAGYPNTGSLAARSYLNYGRKLDKPEPGCIVVFWRGSPTSWEGHVAFYVRDDGTHIRVLGGNQGNAVTEASFPKSQVLGYRWPVAPTAKSLEAAGSTEIPAAKALQRVAEGAAAVETVVTTTQPAPVLPPIPVDMLTDTLEHVTLGQRIMEALNAVAALINNNRTTLVLGLCLAAWVAGWYWRKRRMDKARSGQPIGVGG